MKHTPLYPQVSDKKMKKIIVEMKKNWVHRVINTGDKQGIQAEPPR